MKDHFYASHRCFCLTHTRKGRKKTGTVWVCVCVCVCYYMITGLVIIGCMIMLVLGMVLLMAIVLSGKIWLLIRPFWVQTNQHKQVLKENTLSDIFGEIATCDSKMACGPALFILFRFFCLLNSCPMALYHGIPRLYVFTSHQGSLQSHMVRPITLCSRL